MATLDVCFDNRLGGGMLSPRQIASLTGQTAKATERHDHSSLFGSVQVVSAGAWDDQRVDMILSGEEPVIARFRQDGVDRPQVSIGYTRMGDDPHYVALSEVTLLSHARTIELPQVPTATPVEPTVAVRVDRAGLERLREAWEDLDDAALRQQATSLISVVFDGGDGHLRAIDAAIGPRHRG